MALVRWRNGGDIAPWSALQNLEGDMSRLFGELSRDFNWPEGAWMPPADLHETDDAYLVELDVPGMNKEDIELTTMENVLTIKGERKNEHHDEGKGYRRFERRYGGFQRSFEIPGGFNGDKVEAHYENGVLRVTLPKREEAKPKAIEVRVN